MYFLQCIDYLFNTKLHGSDIVKAVQNAHVFCVSISCGLGLVYYAHYSFDVIPFLTKMCPNLTLTECVECYSLFWVN
uniref:Uncharacterized protein n=1 Tax=viral metagenome TaxID=1070528 RepID=A0A6C0HJC0_9ZZZZ